MIAVNSMIN